MKLILRSAAFLAVVAFTSVALLAADGVTMSQRVTTDGTEQTTQVQIIKDKMRADVGTGTNKQFVIFDATRNVISIVNPERQTYSEMTKEQIDQMASQMQGMMAQMQAAMANMPPAQRAQMEGMMRGRMGGAAGAPAKIEYRQTGTDRVGQWTCDKYEGIVNGQKVADVCTVNPTVIGLTPADAAVMGQLADLFKGMAAMASQMTGVLNIGLRPEEQGFAGIPIRSVMTVGGRQVTSELTTATRQDIPDSQFQVPAGFQKQDIMGGMMGGRGPQ